MTRTEKEITPTLLGISNLTITTATALRAHGELYEAGPIDRQGRRLCGRCGDVLGDPDRFNCDDCAEELYWQSEARDSVAAIDKGGYAQPNDPEELALVL